MNGEIARAALDGALVEIMPDCWPCREKVKYIKVILTKQTWNGMSTMNRKVSVGETPEQTEEKIAGAVKEMARTIETPCR